MGNKTKQHLNVKHAFKSTLSHIVPSTTLWLPRYYHTLKLVGKEGPILDASCGTGDVTIELEKKTGQVVIGINLSKEEIMLASEKAEKQGIKLNLVIGDLTRSPFRDNIFNQIISLDTLEHIEEDNKVFQEFARMLQSSGLLLLSVPYGATNSAELFIEQRILRKLTSRAIYTSSSFKGKSWLEATKEDTMNEMGHLRDYSIGKLREENQHVFEITHHEYGLKKFGSLATDITYGIKGFSLLKPFIFFIAVRLDHYFQKNNKGYSLIAEMKRKVG